MTPEDAQLLADLLRQEAEENRQRLFGTPSPTEVAPAPVPEPVVEAPAPEQDTQNMYDAVLGIDPGITESEIYAEYQQAKRRLDLQQMQDLDASPELLAEQQRELEDKYLRQSVDASGRDVGSAFKSDILLNTDGFVLGDDGRPRKAGSGELLYNSILRQAIGRGPEFEQHVAMLKKEHEAEYEAARAEGLSHEQAIEKIQPWTDWLVNNINYDTRTIDESIFMSTVRGVLGGFASGVSEFVFDSLPLFYEVNANGEMQYPDDPMDLMAYQLGQMQSLRDTELFDTPYGPVTIREITDTFDPFQAIGKTVRNVYDTLEPEGVDLAQTVRETIESVPGGDFVGWMPYYGLRAMKHNVDLVPEAFVAIDRDAPTPDDVEGRRVAASTGAFVGDVAMAIARGRSYYDDLLSIPSYREKLGEDYRLAMLPAFLGEIVTPVAPLRTAGKAFNYLAKTTNGASRAANPAAWGRAFAQHRAYTDMLAEGEEAASAFEVLRTQGSVLHQAAEKMSREVTTPAALYAAREMDAAALGGLAKQSESAQYILRRAEEVGLDQAYYDWRIGLEVEALAQTIRLKGPGASDDVMREMVRLISDGAGLDAARYLSTSDLYAPALKAAADGDVVKAFAYFKAAARRAGSMGINSTHVRVRQVLRAADQVAAGRTLEDIASSPAQLLAPYLTTVRAAGKLDDVFKGVAPAVRTAAEVASGLSRMGRLAFEDLLHAYIPRNLEMVTKRIMVPRNLNTPKVMSKVGAIERMLLKVDDIEVAGADAVRVTTDKERLRNVLREVLPGVGRRGEWLSRSPMYRDIDNALATDGVLTPTQYEVLADTVREAGYRQVMGEAVQTPAFGGREIELAARPTVSVGGERVPRRFAREVWQPLLDSTMAILEGTRRAVAPVAAATPEAARVQNAAAARGYLAAKMERPVEAMQAWLQQGNPNMPAPLKEALAQVSNAMGVIRRQFDTEGQDLRRAAARRGSSTPGPDATNEMVQRRFTEVAERSDQKLADEVARLREEHALAKQRNPRALMPSDAELAWLVVYRSGGREVDVGRRMRAISAMRDGDELNKMYRAAEAWMRRSAIKQQWRNLLSDFFGAHQRTLRSATVVEQIHDDVMKLVDGVLSESVLVKPEARKIQRQLDAQRVDLAKMEPESEQATALVAEIYDVIDDLAGRAYEMPTVEGMQRVVARMRDLSPGLQDRGAARFKPSLRRFTLFEDAIYEAMNSWMLAFDQQKAVTRIFGKMVDQHPEMRLDLAPPAGTQAWAESTVARIYTPVDAVQNVIKGMYEQAVRVRPNDTERYTKLYNAAVKRLQTPGPVSGTGQRPPRPRYYHDPELPKYITKRLRAAEQAAVKAQQDFVAVIDQLAETVAATRYDAPLGKLPALPTSTGDVLRAQTLRDAGPEAIESARVELGKLTKERAKVLKQRNASRKELSSIKKKRRKKFKDDAEEARVDAQIRMFQEEVDTLSDQYDNFTRQIREQNTIIKEAAKGIKTRSVQVGRKAARVQKLQLKKLKAEQRVADAKSRLRDAEVAAEQYKLDNQVLTREQTGVDQILRYVDVRMNSMGGDELAKIAEAALDAIVSQGSLHVSPRTVMQLSKAGDTHQAKALLSSIGQSIRDMQHMRTTGDALHDALVEFTKVIPDKRLSRTVTNAIAETVDLNINSHIFDTVADTLRGYGLTTAAHKGAVHQIMRGVAQIPERDLAVLPEMVGIDEGVKKLRSAARNGKLLNTLANLQKRNVISGVEQQVTGKLNSYVRFGLDVAATTAALSRSVVSYGLLAGGIVFGVAGLPIPVPFVSRYIGLNALTAPSIMLGTLGAVGVAKTLGNVPAEALRTVRTAYLRRKNLVDVASPRMPDDIRMVDRYGKTWTVRESEALLEEWNWYMSRGTVDQSADLMLDMQRSMRVMVDEEGLKNLPWYSLVQQHLFSPRRTSIGMQFATGVDSVFRRSTFLSAIRDGQTPAAAAELARASVLDYGAVPDFIKQSVNRYMLFATFKMASYSEIMKALARGDDAFLRVMRIQERLHESMNTWAYGEDYDRVRFFNVPVGEVDNRPIIVGGPQDPFASNAAELIQMTAFLASMLPFTEDGGPVGRRMTETLREQNLMPLAQLAVLSMTEANLTRGRLVPDVWVLRMQQAGYFEDFRRMFPMKPVTRPVFGGRDRRRPGSGTFTKGAVQYEFTPAGYERWARAQLLATQLTAKRTTEEFTKGQIAAGYYPEDYNPKYRGTVGFIPYFMGVATDLKGKRKDDIYTRAWMQTQFLNR
jgi:hypothetical protein